LRSDIRAVNTDPHDCDQLLAFVRGHDTRWTTVQASVIMILAYGLGVIDGLGALAETRERFAESEPPLIGERHRQTWSRIVVDKKHLVTIPPLNNDPQRIDMASIANDAGMTTTSAYLGRLNVARFQSVLSDGEATLRQRRFRNDTVYVIMNYPPHPLDRILETEAENPTTNGGFFATRIENLLVVYMAPMSGDFTR